MTARRLGLAALMVTAACSPFGGDDDDAARDGLAAARQLWATQGVNDYDILVLRLCFCGSETTGPVRVQVRGGQVTARTYLEDGNPVPAAFASGFPAVEGLFDFVEDAIDRDSARLEVEYDPARGFPTRAFADYVANAADEEQGYTVVGFEPGP